MHITSDMIEDCKRELPPVMVDVNGNVLWGRTSGRRNRFCTVSVTNEGTLHSRSNLFMDFEFSWQAVCRAVVSGVPLKV